MAPALVSAWNLIEADATLTGVLVAVFAAFAAAYLVQRFLSSRKRRKR